MTRIIVVRHGYSATNADRRYTGQMDVPLTDIGRRQAHMVAAYLAKHEKIDAIFASDLSRAMDTAMPTANSIDLTVTPVRELRELGMGIWEGMRFEDVEQNYPNELARRSVDHTYPCPGGESMAELHARVTNTLARLAREHEGKCIMLVTHGGAIRAVRCMAASGDARDTARFPNTPNAAISIYRFENGRLYAEQEDIVSHLTETAAAPSELY